MVEQAAAEDGVDAEQGVSERRVIGGSAFEVEVFNGAQARGCGVGWCVGLWFLCSGLAWIVNA